jgi:beta-glucosidase
MPWLDHVEGVLEAWYPGSSGGEAIARILTGGANPSSRLPLTFPQSEAQLPRPELPGYAAMLEARRTSGNPHAPPPPFVIDYFEGANVGYRWFETRGLTPLFPFGYGLSYTSFSYSNLKVAGGGTLTVSFDVTNTGTRAGSDTPQVYASQGLIGADSVRHLVGWSKITLEPGQTHRVSVVADPRLIAHFDSARRQWHVPAGTYHAFVGRFAGDAQLSGDAALSDRQMAP